MVTPPNHNVPLTVAEQTVVDLAADYQLAEGEPTPIAHVVLALPHAAEGELRATVKRLAVQGLLHVAGYHPNEHITLTARGLLASGRRAEVTTFAEAWLAYVKQRLEAEKVRFKQFSWGDLKAAGVVRGDEQFSFAIAAMQAFMLLGGGSWGRGPPAQGSWALPADFLEFRRLEDIHGLSRRVGIWHERWGQGQGAPSSSAAPHTPTSQPMTTIASKTLNILFMDLAGWSKLSAPKILVYLEKALPKLAEKVNAFRATHQNTWGDALVATFENATDAANCALDIRDYFKRASEADGVPRGTMPRISLHVGDVIVAHNPLVNREDIFGDAVHLAARLEPVTARGQVYCTAQFASALRGLEGAAPVAHELGEVELPKGFGVVEVFAVTGPNDDAPQRLPSRGASSGADKGNPDAALKPLGDDETKAILQNMLRTLPAKTTTLTYEQVIEKCHPRVSREAIQRLLPGLLPGSSWTGGAYEATVVLQFHLRQPTPDREPRGFG